MKVKIWTDGGSRGNPGPSAIGYVIQADRPVTGRCREKGGARIPDTTNNVAEYTALLQALKALRLFEDLVKEKTTDLTIYTDSTLLVGQLSANWRVNTPHLIPLHREVKQLLSKHANYSLEWIPRELNKEADGIVNAVLDGEWKA